MGDVSLDSPGMRELIVKLAAWPHGLGFLHLSDVDTVAVTLHVDPFLVTAARDALEVPDRRARLIEAVHECRRHYHGHPPRIPCPPAHPEAHAAPGTLTAAELIRAAREHPLGEEFLREGHPEAVAVTFRVHPCTVFEARQLLNGGSEDGSGPGAS